jgi:DNA-binding LytR/AlgR family response regulator
MLITCIIVDDEPLARDVLQKYIADCPRLKLVDSCSSAFEAIESVKKNNAGLIFLDINMPKLSGISMIRTMDDPPEVIFTTAYPEFAVEGFELDAADYLVKPFSFERFMKAVNKASRRLEMKNSGGGREYENREDQRYLLVKCDGKLYRVDYERIHYLEACGDYVKVHTEEETLLTHDTLKRMEGMLPGGKFLRIHRSFIIALDRIQFIEGNRIRIGDDDIPVAASCRERLMMELDRRSEQAD